MFFIDFVIDYIKLFSILHEPDVIDTLPEKIKDDQVPSIVYRLDSRIRSKIFNYKTTMNEIDANDKSGYGTGLTS